MKIDIYDNEGKTFDQYTIFIDNNVFAMSKDATGFNQYCGDYKRDGKIITPKGRHLGKKVDFYDLNEELQKAIKDRI